MTARLTWRRSAVVALPAVVLAVSLALADTPAAKPSPEALEKQARAVLQAHCYRCHSHEAAKNKGGLVLDSLAAMTKGGDSGPAVVAGQPDKGLLLRAVRYEDDELRMPPKGKIPDADVAVLEAWVRAGAPWKDTDHKQPLRTPGKITDEDRRYWAFQPPADVKPPDVDDPAWAKNPVDRFVRDRLAKEVLKPSPPAEKRSLVRRVYFDLTGLPPTPREVEAFVNDASPDAYEALVDRLLASPRYGEHWARHWLDLVRYAESDGFRLDSYRPTAWRYRDYVIKALNDDKPYDAFVREQLAGDEIAPDDPEVLVATGYLCHGVYEYNQRDARTQWDGMINEITDVTGDVFLGLGMQCARCHDHKYDPILQKDYYRLRAFFTPLLPPDETPLATPKQREAHDRQLAAWMEKTVKVRAQIEQIEAPEREKVSAYAVSKFPKDIQAILHKPVKERTPLEHQLGLLAYRQVQYEVDRLDSKIKGDAKTRLLDLRKELAKFDRDRPAPLPTAPTARDIGKQCPTTHLPKRTGEDIEPGFLTLLDEKPAVIPPVKGETTGRRLALAKWLTRPDHPLTARVIVNRVWQQHFGRGIVSTPSDFGKLGEKPSHPELLDWLARNFVAEGWSLKKLHRLLVTSQTYRQSSTAPADAEAIKKDPENRLLWRMVTRRLSAEQIRDSLLAMTGKLDLTAGGPSVEPREARRSIYTKVQRNTRDPLLDVFDWPESFTSTSQRNVTTTPTQALLLLNSPLMLQQARQFADRLHKDVPGTDEDRIDAAFRLAFGRPADDQERLTAVRFLADQARRVKPGVPVATTQETARLPFREGRAAVLVPGTSQARFEVSGSPKMDADRFTVEAFVMLRSVFDDATVRTIASHWDGDQKGAGWVFGVTGKKSAYKQQMLVLQVWGDDAKGKPAYEAVFSGLQMTLNRPYYVAVSVDLTDTDERGITFYARDLSNDEEPTQVYPVPHKITRMPAQRGPFLIGATPGKLDRNWDGLIDDVRLSNTALRAKDLLVNNDTIGPATIAFWQFEPTPGMLRDSSPNGHHLTRLGVRTATAADSDPRRAAWADLCQVLLNANEFLYID